MLFTAAHAFAIGFAVKILITSVVGLQNDLLNSDRRKRISAPRESYYSTKYTVSKIRSSIQTYPAHVCIP